MKKKVFRERYKVLETKEYRNPYVEGEIVKDELLINEKGNKKVNRTITKETKKKKSDK